MCPFINPPPLHHLRWTRQDKPRLDNAWDSWAAITAVRLLAMGEVSTWCVNETRLWFAWLDVLDGVLQACESNHLHPPSFVASSTFSIRVACHHIPEKRA